MREATIGGEQYSGARTTILISTDESKNNRLLDSSQLEAGIIDVLLGHFSNGEPVMSGSTEHHRVLSIIDNLNRLFNTRRGSIMHLPDYGLPDITQVYRDLPYSIDGLRTAIKEVVEKYEPRLRRVRVETQEKTTDEKFDMRISFIVRGEMLKGQRVQFQTVFTSNELAHVFPWRKPS
jgi:type VI secretion system protein